MKTVIVAGFGSFEGVIDNPSSAIAQALDGCVLNGVSILGREMPVSYQRSVEVCRMWLQSTGAVGVVGIGVAVNRSVVTVERTGVLPRGSGRCDVDGQTGPACAAGAVPSIQSTIDVDTLAEMIGAEVGDDAGNYVCNGWLYKAVTELDVPVGFIHVPPNGLDSGKLLLALSALWGDEDGE